MTNITVTPITISNFKRSYQGPWLKLFLFNNNTFKISIAKNIAEIDFKLIPPLIK